MRIALLVVSLVVVGCDRTPPTTTEHANAEAHEIDDVLELIERGGALVYIATPHTQSRTEFVITTLEPNHFVAETVDGGPRRRPCARNGG